MLYPLSYGRTCRWKVSVYQRLSVVSRRVVAHRRMVHRRFLATGVQRIRSNRRMESCSPFSAACKYVEVWDRFVCPNISCT